MEVRHQVEIASPPGAVFDFLVDTDNFLKVDPALVSYTPRGVMRVGLQGTFVHRRGGMIARSTWEVAEIDRPTRVRVAVRGMGYAMDEVAVLSASATGTLASFTDVVRPTSIAGRVMVALSGRIMRRDLARRAALLKAALEGTAEES